MKREFFVLCLMFIVSIPMVFSILVPSDPICNIKGTIEKVEFKEEDIDPCILDELIDCPPPGLLLNLPERYDVSVNIKEVKLVEFQGVGIKPKETCEKWNSELGIKVFTIAKKNIIKDYHLTVGNTIEFKTDPYHKSFFNYSIMLTADRLFHESPPFPPTRFQRILNWFKGWFKK